MVNVSADFLNAVVEPFRDVQTKVDFNNGTILYGYSTDGSVMELELNENGETNEGIGIGQTIINTATVKIRMPSVPIPLKNGTMQPYIGLVLPDSTTEWVSLGYFYIAETVTEDDYGTVTITGYDGFSRIADVPYATTLALPCTLEDIVDDICTQTGITCDTLTFPAVTIDTIYDGTQKETLGWMAGLMGMNARFNRDGHLEFYWYDTSSPSVTIDRDIQFLNGVTITAEDVTIQSITSGSESNHLVVGSGYGITHYNPYMTQTILDGIGNVIIGTTFTPCTVEWRGNPAMEIGDVATVVDKDENGHAVLIMRHTLTGAMTDSIECIGFSDQTYALQKSPTQQRINAVYTALQQAIIDASALINGARGGIYRVTDADNDGVNDGWLLSDSPNIAAAQRFIRANSAGIGLSKDGGLTYQTAITADGINASTVTTGQMSAERISVTGYTLSDYFKVEPDGLGHVVVTIGSSDNSIVLKEENDRIGFYDGNGTLLAYFSNNSFEIVDLSRFRIGSLAIVTQTNGSVSFVRGD